MHCWVVGLHDLGTADREFCGLSGVVGCVRVAVAVHGVLIKEGAA